MLIYTIKFSSAKREIMATSKQREAHLKQSILYTSLFCNRTNNYSNTKK